jgi:hypothetical protein
MSRSLLLTGAVLVCSLGCGRLGFGSYSLGEDPFAPDADPFAPDADPFAPDADPFAPDGPPTLSGRSNVAFVTSGTFDGKLGGVAGANEKCGAAAISAGLNPTSFVAMLATSGYRTTALPAFLGSRVWVRTDDVLVADLPTEFSATGLGIRNPINRDENRNLVSGPIWTGMSSNGQGLIDNCQDFASNSSSFEGAIGSGEVANAVLGAGTGPCATVSAHLLCVSIGVQGFTVVNLPAGLPLRVFVSSSNWTVSNQASADSLCQSDATAAGLLGALDQPARFVALLPSGTQSAFDHTGGNDKVVMRVDGSVIGRLKSGQALTFVSQLADGTFIGDVNVRTGGAPHLFQDPADTCNRWTNPNQFLFAKTGSTTRLNNSAWDVSNVSCATPTRIYCIEQL